MPGRRWSEGLHQAVEAKEGLRVQRESRTLATITFQNYFRLYDKLAGMTGTAMTEAEEFHKIYKLEVVAIPTHRPMIRDDYAGPRLPQRDGKFNALIDEIEEMTEAGRPVLVGTVSVEKSEVLVDAAQAARHQARGAQRQAAREGGGRSSRRPAGRGAVTIATNMAGRGTDILLGGNPAGLASEILHKQGLNPAEVDKATYDAALDEAKADHRGRPRRASSRPAACTSSAPSATRAAGSTTSCAAAPAARATPARRASTCRSTTT